jgi:hypothetical protein
MTKKTRYFMAGSAAVLTAGLVTGLVAYTVGGFQPVSAAPVANELRYIPADASVVAYADVRSIMDSQFRQQLKAAMPTESQHGQEEFLRETGIDIERDLDYIVAAVTGGNPKTGGLLVARGRFNSTQLETLALEHGGVVEDYRGKRVVNSPVNEHTQEQFTLAFVEPDLVAMGVKSAVQKAIDASLNAQSVTGNNEMMEVINDVSYSNGQMNNAWAVGRFDVIASQANLPAEIAQRMPPIKWFAAAGHINGGISGMLRAEANDEHAADLLRRQISGLLALGEMVAGTDPKAAVFTKSLQMSGSGKTVALSFTVPAELLQLLPQAAGVTK